MCKTRAYIRLILIVVYAIVFSPPHVCFLSCVTKKLTVQSTLTFWHGSFTFNSNSGDSRAVYVVGPAGPTTNTARLSPR